MKKTILIFALAGLLAVGCEKTKKCDSPFAPFEISTTEYNSVHSVIDYFNCHDSTLLQHDEDSVLICGYIVEKDIYYYLVDDRNDVKSPYLIQYIDYTYTTDCTKKYYFKAPVYVYESGVSNDCCRYKCRFVLTKNTIEYSE